MDTLSMLANARITDMDGDDMGEVVAVHYVNGKLYLTVDTGLIDGEYGGDDPDGGEKIEVDKEQEPDSPKEGLTHPPLRSIAGGKL